MGIFSLPAINMAVVGSFGSIAGAISCCDSGGSDNDKRFECSNCGLNPMGVVFSGEVPARNVGVECADDGLLF